MDKGEGVFTMAATMQKKMDSKGFFRDYGIILLGVSIFHHYWNDRTWLETFYIGMIAAAALLLFGDLEATPVDTILCEAALALHTLHCLLWE